MQRQALNTARLNPAAKEFVPAQQVQLNPRLTSTVEDDLRLIQDETNAEPKQSPDLLLSRDDLTATFTRRPETSIKAAIAVDPHKSNLITDDKIEAREMPSWATVNECLQDLWAIHKKLEKSTGKMQVAGNNILGYEHAVEMEVCSAKEHDICEEAFREFEKALNKQEELVQEFKRRLVQANVLLTRDCAGEDHGGLS